MQHTTTRTPTTIGGWTSDHFKSKWLAPEEQTPAQPGCTNAPRADGLKRLYFLKGRNDLRDGSTSDDGTLIVQAADRDAQIGKPRHEILVTLHTGQRQLACSNQTKSKQMGSVPSESNGKVHSSTTVRAAPPNRRSTASRTQPLCYPSAHR